MASSAFSRPEADSAASSSLYKTNKEEKSSTVYDSVEATQNQQGVPKMPNGQHRALGQTSAHIGNAQSYPQSVPGQLPAASPRLDLAPDGGWQAWTVGRLLRFELAFAVDCSKLMKPVLGTHLVIMDTW
jgi:hypothetical protein